VAGGLLVMTALFVLVQVLTISIARRPSSTHQSKRIIWQRSDMGKGRMVYSGCVTMVDMSQTSFLDTVEVVLA
jgi:hypothetical protein